MATRTVTRPATNRTQETTKPDSKNMTAVKAAMRAMMPTLLATIVAVLDKEELGNSRAFVLSDLPGALTGDRQATYMLARRVAAAGMDKAMGRITGKIRAEHARVLHDEFAGIPTQNEEETAETNELVG